MTQYTSIDPNDRDQVLWLQMALAKLMPGPTAVVHIGMISPLTEKALRLFQLSRGMRLTGQADAETLSKIYQELQEKGL